MKRYAIYSRVSTLDKQNLDTQVILLKEYCKARNFVIHKEYSDKISGSKDSRPWLDMLMEDARKRRIDAIIVYKFDRFSRSLATLINSLELLNNLWVDFISITENVESSTPTWKLMFSLISSFAEFERSLIRERVVAGLHRAKQNGVKLWRPKVDTDVLKIVKLKDSWMSFRDIALKMKLKKSNVYNKYTSYKLSQV